MTAETVDPTDPEITSEDALLFIASGTPLLIGANLLGDAAEEVLREEFDVEESEARVFGLFVLVRCVQAMLKNPDTFPDELRDAYADLYEKNATQQLLKDKQDAG